MSIYDTLEMSNELSTPNDGDCLACRLISGCGVMGMGAYIYSHSNNRAKIQMWSMRLLACGAIGLGVARVLNMSFLKSNKKTS